MTVSLSYTALDKDVHERRIRPVISFTGNQTSVRRPNNINLVLTDPHDATLFTVTAVKTSNPAT